jgi:hypothetical protein
LSVVPAVVKVGGMTPRASFKRRSISAALCVAVVLSGLGAVAGPATVAVAAPPPGPGGVTDGLLTWLDAADPDADGNPANNPADGTALNTWKDLSGNDNDAVRLAGKNAGTYTTAPAGSINGQATVDFRRVNDGQGSIYDIPGVDVRAVTHEDLTLLAVYRPRTLEMNNGVFGNDNGNWDRFFLSYIPFFGNGVDDGVASLGPAQRGVVVPRAGVRGTVRLMTLAYDGNVTGTTNQGPTDGSAVYFNGEVVRRFTDSTHPSDAQRSLRVGWDGDNSVFDGHIAEVVVYDRVLTNEELRDVNYYLSLKYDFTVATPLTPPGAPTNLVAAPATGEGPISFTPGADGGSPITNYEYSLDGTTWVPFSPAVTSGPVTVPGLEDGVPHQVWLRAVNAVGPGDRSAPVTVLNPKVPDAPTGLVAAPHDGSATIAFTDGADGGSPITGYEYSIDGGDWTGLPGETSSPVTVDGLANGATYSLRLRAVNAVGAGAPSLPVIVEPVPGPALPDPPTALVPTPGDASASIAFTAPVSDGGSPLTNYEYSIDGGLTWVAFGPVDAASPVVLTGLTNGTTYEVVLRAVNAVGAGEPSEAVTVVPRTVPGAPTALSATPMNGAAAVNFTAPADDGGSPVTNYEYSTDGGTTWVPFDPAEPVSPVVVNGLTNGAPTSIVLRAVNEVGAGPASSPVLVTAVAAVTSAPVWTDSTLATPARGRPYSDGVLAVGDGPITYLVVGGLGSLPAGLTLNPTTGAVTGTPTTAGPYRFTIAATSSYGFVLAAFSGTVTQPRTGVMGAVSFIGTTGRLQPEGRRALDLLAAAVPRGAQNVQVQVFGWAEARRTTRAVLQLGATRVKVTTAELKRRGVAGVYSGKVGGRYPVPGRTGRRSEVVITWDN